MIRNLYDAQLLGELKVGPEIMAGAGLSRNPAAGTVAGFRLDLCSLFGELEEKLS